LALVFDLWRVFALGSAEFGCTCRPGSVPQVTNTRLVLQSTCLSLGYQNSLNLIEPPLTQPFRRVDGKVAVMSLDGGCVGLREADRL
jgi:hypothetical protein